MHEQMVALARRGRMKSAGVKHLAALVGVVCLAHAHCTSAVGFALEQQSASNAGYAFAGAASVEDASVMFWNPAALSHIQGTQAIVGVHAIYGHASFTDQGSLSPAGPTFPLTGGTGGNPSGLNWLPNAYLSTHIRPDVSVGLGITSPFGLKTDYPPDWIGRYQAVSSVLKTININPTLAWKVTPTLSIGAGVSFQYFDARISNAIDFGAACFGSPFGPAACAAAGVVPQSKDGLAEIRGDSWGVGWNAGAVFDVHPRLRAGIAYRSAIKHEIQGNATFSNPSLPAPFSLLTAGATNTGAQTTITTPDSVSLNTALAFNENLTAVSDITWTGWSKFRELRVRFDSGSPDAVLPANWRNTFRFGMGLGYSMNDRLKLRTGVAYEQSAIPDAFRTARIPDNDHTLVALGLNYKTSRTGSVDVAYHHGFVRHASVNTTVAGGGTLLGNYKVSADVLSIQYNHGF